MPLVQIRYKIIHNGNQIDPDVIRELGPALQYAVANRLGSPDGELSPEDIEVTFVESHPFDVGDHQINIDIEAMHKPLRDKGDEQAGVPNFGQRVHGLDEDLRQMLPSSVSYGLWVKLNNARWFSDDPADDQAMLDSASSAANS